MKSKTYLLYGLGKTNESVKRFFDENNIKYYTYCDGDLEEIDLSKIDIVIKSPGIYPNTSFMNKLKNSGIKIINDLELFYLIYPKAKLIIITGTNGKTSTAVMMAIVLNKKYKTYLAGNIGTPLFSIKSKKNFIDEFVVVEASSYMLEHCDSVVPYAYLLLNISPHHLGYHQSFSNYLEAKTKLIKNIKDGIIIYQENDLFDSIIKAVDCLKISVYKDHSSNGVYFKDYVLYSDNEVVYKIKKDIILPYHQINNMLYVVALAKELGIKPEKIRKGLEEVSFQKYRLQKIYEDDQTIIINDSKATNFEASFKAIESINDPSFEIHWILGGLGPNNFDILKETKNLVDGYYVYGDNSSLIEKDLISLNSNYQVFDSLDDIIKQLKNNKNKKVILYSPAAQSFDHFMNFEERGLYFTNLINKYFQK